MVYIQLQRKCKDSLQLQLNGVRVIDEGLWLKLLDERLSCSS